MNELRRYVNIGSDSARWEQYEHRPGDVIISTPPKSGTTLTQRVCSLAIFKTGGLPQPLELLSPWFDHHSRGDDEALALVQSHEHRRFIKTHTPLDGIPYWDDVTYLNTARDPRDIFVSWEAQMTNLDRERTLAALASGVGMAKVEQFLQPPPETVAERADQWLEEQDFNNFSLARHLHQMQLAWQRQSAPNVFLFHFNDLRRDRKATLRTIAGALNIELTDEQIDELAPYSGFETMRADAANLAPNTKGIFTDPEKFFRSGTTGGWQEMLSAKQIDRYHERTTELTSRDFIEWLESC